MEKEDYLQLSPDNLGKIPAWKVLPGAVYKVSYKDLIDLVNDEGDLYYEDLMKSTNLSLTFTIIWCGRQMSEHWDASLFFVKELGVMYAVDSKSTLVPTTEFVEVLPLEAVLLFREAYEQMLEWER